MRKPMRKQRSEGFTLVEVLVALALGAVCLLFIAQLFLNGIRSNAVAWDYTALNSLARQRLEELLQYNFNDPRLAVPAGSTVTLGGTAQKGKLYLDQSPNTQTVSGNTISYPYELVYVVQDFHLTDLVNTGNPDPLSATVDTDGTWDHNHDVKYVTVIAASQRSGLQKTTYDLAGGLSALATGKQIRIGAVKAP
jgi:prepilin-type N-terminal cleavage/methylation domain-containing protein